MKKELLPLVVLLLGSIWADAQENNSGKVTYQQVIKLDFELEGDAAQFANLMPKEQKSQKILYFNPEITLFKNDNSVTSENASFQSGSGNVMIQMSEPENIVFTNLAKKRQTEQREFMTRTFLIEGEPKLNWKLSGSHKMILEYPCQEAILETVNDTITAWFTPVIPVSGGPANYFGLPGLILAVSTPDGKVTTTAISIDFSPLTADDIHEPSKGKKVTREEFDKIVEEKMKEMGAEQSGNGTHVVIGIRR